MPELANMIARGRGAAAPPSISLEVTPEMLATLQKMSRDSQLPLEVVFTRAIGLYQASMKATAEGKHVGYAASPDALEVEFTGLAGPGLEGR